MKNKKGMEMELLVKIIILIILLIAAAVLWKLLGSQAGGLLDRFLDRL